jgi:two-component system chemotaxis response regulator CheY
MPLTILYVEDHRLVAETVTATLEAEGWRVVWCVDGVLALSKLAGAAPYDLLLTDNHLPHLNGLELVRYARTLKHRAALPIVMFSGVDCQTEAEQAGVNVFLRKPTDTAGLIPVIASLARLE